MIPRPELAKSNLNTKFEVFSFIHSKVRTGAQKFIKVTWWWHDPFRGGLSSSGYDYHGQPM